MDRPIAIKRLKRILEVKSKNLDMYDKEALKMALASLETDETYQLEYESTTKNDLGVDVPDNNVGNIDCISRTDILEFLHQKELHYGVFKNKVDWLEIVKDCVTKIPSVTPKSDNSVLEDIKLIIDNSELEAREVLEQVKEIIRE